MFKQKGARNKSICVFDFPSQYLKLQFLFPCINTILYVPSKTFIAFSLGYFYFGPAQFWYKFKTGFVRVASIGANLKIEKVIIYENKSNW